MYVQRDANASAGKSVDDLITIDEETGLQILPHWLAQPYFRPLPKELPAKAPLKDAAVSQVPAELGTLSASFIFLRDPLHLATTICHLRSKQFINQILWLFLHKSI